MSRKGLAFREGGVISAMMELRNGLSQSASILYHVLPLTLLWKDFVLSANVTTCRCRKPSGVRTYRNFVTDRIGFGVPQCGWIEARALKKYTFALNGDLKCLSQFLMVGGSGRVCVLSVCFARGPGGGRPSAICLR